MRRYVQIEDVTGVEGQKRLDHYNKWLMDPSRPFTSAYPGYPGDEVSEEIPEQDDPVLKKQLPGSLKPL